MAINDYFGFSVAVSDKLILFGSIWKNGIGAVYSLELPSPIRGYPVCKILIILAIILSSIGLLVGMSIILAKKDGEYKLSNIVVNTKEGLNTIQSKFIKIILKVRPIKNKNDSNNPIMLDGIDNTMVTTFSSVTTYSKVRQIPLDENSSIKLSDLGLDNSKVMRESKEKGKIKTNKNFT